jgi:NitT/TauT family transport system ATP-binding protein
VEGGGRLTPAPAIDVRGVGKEFLRRGNRVVALHDVSLAIGGGDFVAIVGPSGCGKSTLLNLVAGLDRPSTGTVLVEGRPVDGPHPIGYMFQTDSLLPWRTVLENAELGPELAGAARAARRERVLALLARVGLAEFAHALPHELSGGMRKRAQLAAVLANDPRVVLMDEPFAALDAQTRAVLEDLAEAILLATRVVIFTARPGRVKSEYAVGLPAAESTLEQRTTREFHEHYARIWADLRDEVGHRLR